MECKGHIRYYWNSNVDFHIRFCSFAVEEERNWMDFLNQKIRNSKKVLELGCGTGNLTNVLIKAGYEVTALDISVEMLKRLKMKTNGNSKILIGDAELPSFKEESFDAVVCRNLLCTIPNPEKALREWFKILKNNGKLCVIERINENGFGIKKRIELFLMMLIENCLYNKIGYEEDIAKSIPFYDGFEPETLKSIILNSGFRKVEVDMMRSTNMARKVAQPFYRSLWLDDNFCVTAVK